MNVIFPPYLGSLGFSLARIGFIVSLFGIMRLAARLPAGALYTEDRAKAMIGGCLVFLAISTAGFAYEGGTVYLMALSVIHGLAFGAVTTMMLALAIEVKAGNHSYGAAMGWYTASLSAGYAIGSLLAGYLVDHFAYGASFMAIGFFPLVGALVIAGLSRAALAPLAFTESSSQRLPASREQSWPRKLLELRRLSPEIFLATLVAFYINFLDDAFGAFFPLFGLSLGLSLTTIGLLKSVKSFCATSIRPLSGFVFRVVSYGKVNNASILLWSMIVFLMPSLKVAWGFVFMFILIGLSRGLIRVTSATMVAEEKAEDTRGLGLASAVYNAGLDIGAFGGPIAGGLLASVTGISGMFRLVPLGLLLLYFSALLLVDRMVDRTAVTC